MSTNPQNKNLEYLLKGTLDLVTSIAKINAQLDYDQTVSKIKAICDQEFKTSTEFIPPGEVRRYFKEKREDILKSLRKRSYSEEKEIYVPLKNNGDANLGVLVLKGVVPDFLNQGEGIKDRVFDYLGSECGRILAEKKNQEKMLQKAYCDELTGIPLLRGFKLEYSKFLKRGKSFYYVSIDLDNFKGLNDTYGHGQGDQALKAFSKAIQSNLRTGDYFARVGGDEFKMLIRAESDKEAENAAERFRKLVNGIVLDTKDITDIPNPERKYHLAPDKISCSIGLAGFPKDSNKKSELARLADQALYGAKHGKKGKDQVLLYSKSGAIREE